MRRTVLFFLLIFGIISTSVAQSNSVLKDSTYLEIRGNQIFKITKFVLEKDTFHIFGNDTVGGVSFFNGIIEESEVSIKGDSAIIAEHLTVDLYLKSLNGESVLFHQSDSIVDVVWFPYSLNKFRSTLYYLEAGEVFKEILPLQNASKIWLTIVRIFGLSAILFIIAFMYFNYFFLKRWIVTLLWIGTSMFFVLTIWFSVVNIGLSIWNFLFFMVIYIYLPSAIYLIFFNTKKRKALYFLKKSFGFRQEVILVNKILNKYYLFKVSGGEGLFDIEDMKVLTYLEEQSFVEFELNKNLLVIQQNNSSLQHGIYDLIGKKEIAWKKYRYLFVDKTKNQVLAQLSYRIDEYDYGGYDWVLLDSNTQRVDDKFYDENWNQKPEGTN